MLRTDAHLWIPKQLAVARLDGASCGAVIVTASVVLGWQGCVALHIRCRNILDCVACLPEVHACKSQPKSQCCTNLHAFQGMHLSCWELSCATMLPACRRYTPASVETQLEVSAAQSCLPSRAYVVPDQVLAQAVPAHTHPDASRCGISLGFEQHHAGALCSQPAWWC